MKIFVICSFPLGEWLLDYVGMLHMNGKYIESVVSLNIEIPGYKILDLKYLVLDYNGTIAVDGKIPETVKRRIIELSSEFQIYVLTADTHGTARENCQGLPLEILTFPTADAMTEKMKIVTKLGAENCVSIGNGRNDTQMLKQSALAIAVMDREGMYGGLLAEADVCVRSMEDAFDLFLQPKRLIATLRG